MHAKASGISSLQQNFELHVFVVYKICYVAYSKKIELKIYL